MEKHESIVVKSISIVDDSGCERVRVGPLGDGTFGFAIFDESGETKISAANHVTGPAVLLWGGGKPRIQLSIQGNSGDGSSLVDHCPVVRVEGEDDGASIDLTVDRLGDPGLVLWDKNVIPRIQINGVTIDSPGFRLYDQRGQERIAIRDSGGFQAIGFADEDGMYDLEISRGHGIVLPED